MVFVPHRCCCAMMESASCLLVSKKEDTEGGIVAAISAIRSSVITPGPLGIEETRPRADAPCWIASWASLMLLMQQILTRVFFVGCKRNFPTLMRANTSYHARETVSRKAPEVSSEGTIIRQT